MRNLEDAWSWYETNRNLLRVMSRLGQRYWGQLPWQGVLDKDDSLRLLEGEQVVADAGLVLAELDDLAVFMLFSMFEASVRQVVATSLEAEVSGLQHPALRRSARKLMQNIGEGSFYANVLELYKADGTTSEGRATNGLIEEVNRVRRYRNWVAHGRKSIDKPHPILPRTAFDLLQQFLNFLGSARYPSP